MTLNYRKRFRTTSWIQQAELYPLVNHVLYSRLQFPCFPIMAVEIQRAIVGVFGENVLCEGNIPTLYLALFVLKGAGSVRQGVGGELTQVATAWTASDEDNAGL